MITLPRDAEVRARLREILARGSVNLGARAGVERLMLMLTRSCQLRCGYCFVQKTETGQVMPLATARRTIDLLMRSSRPTLEVQLFGGEPTSEWDTLLGTLRYTMEHPARGGRRVAFVLTTNGTDLDGERLARLAEFPVTVLFSVDGDARAHRRYRPVHRGPDATWRHDDATTYAAIDRAIDQLLESGIDWFANIVLPPAAADQVRARYDWARARGVQRLQLNYAVGMAWGSDPASAYLSGLVDALCHHHAHPEGLHFFNWFSDCEPVMLSDDLIVDVDGSVLHDGAIFLERVFSALKTTYRRGHLDDLQEFDPLRLSLTELFEVMVQTYPQGSPERHVILQNAYFGAAVDLTIQRLSRALGRAASRGAGDV